MFLGSFHALVMLVKQGFACMELNCRVFSDENMIIMGGSCFLALLFCMFVGIMFADQISCIVNNTSTIENLKKRNPKFEEESKSHKSEGRTGW